MVMVNERTTAPLVAPERPTRGIQVPERGNPMVAPRVTPVETVAPATIPVITPAEVIASSTNELDVIMRVRKDEAVRRDEEMQRIELLNTYLGAPLSDSAAERMERAEAIFKRRMARSFAEVLRIQGPRAPKNGKRKLALLLPAHNEELIIEATIKSAVAAGQELQDIYVVNDNSSDNTQALAVGMLGEQNVLQVGRSGKALAVKKATDHFNFIDRYEWLHVADADSLFGQDYFRIYSAKLDPTKYAVAIGFVQSLKGNWISTYRALAYTYGQQVHRRIQSGLKAVTVFPGPVTTIRTDIIKDLDYTHTGVAEDFDITLQVHRKKLGGIVYIPGAINYTQDPQHLGDFIKQNQRWMRGFYQGVKKYGIGLHGQRIDFMLGSQMLMTLAFLIQLFVLAPFILFFTPNGWLTVLAMIALDFIVNCAVALGASVAAKRWNLLGAMPYFYFLRFLEIGIHVWAFVEIFILRKFGDDTVMGWSTAGRRYKLSNAAMADAA